MAATNYRGEMMAADELDPKRKVRRGMRMLDPSRAEGPATSDVNFRPRTGSDPAPAPPANGGALGQQPGAGYVALETAKNVGRTFNPLAGGANNNMVPYYTGEGPGISGTLAPKPKTPDQMLMAAADGAGAFPPASSNPPPAGSQGGFAGMGDRSMRDMRPDPETMAMNDTEQGRRDLAMLRKRRNLADAALMGSSNRFSKFYNPGQTPDQRAELILSKEGMNQELATAQRAANPPRYETDPNSERAIRGRESLAGNLDKILMDEARATQLPGGQPGPVDRSGVDQRVSAFRDSIAPKAKSPEQMLAEETAQNRQQQAVAQAATDAQKRALPRERADQMTAAEFDRLLMTEKAGAAAEKARGEGVGLDNEIRKTDSQARLAESQGLLKQTQTARALQDSQYDPATSIEVAQRTMKGVASRFGSGALNRGKADVNIIGRSADEDIRDLEMMDSMVVGPLEAFASADPARARRDASMILNTMPPTTSAGTYAEAGGLLPTTPGVRRVVEKLNAIRARLQAIASGSGSPTTS